MAADRNRGNLSNKKVLKRNGFLMALIGFLAVLLVAGVVSSQMEKNKILVLNQLDEAEKLYNEGTAEKTERLKTILLNLHRSSVSYARQKSLFLSAQLSNREEEWEEAITYFNKLRTNYKHSYLAWTAALNEAYLLEKINKTEDALVIFKLIAQNHSALSPWQEASLNAARLSEPINMDEAVFYYRKLSSELEDGSFWKTIAENRLIALGITY
jgi:tetratricopeptide (TPR) repeat protein